MIYRPHPAWALRPEGDGLLVHAGADEVLAAGDVGEGRADLLVQWRAGAVVPERLPVPVREVIDQLVLLGALRPALPTPGRAEVEVVALGAALEGFAVALDEARRGPGRGPGNGAGAAPPLPPAPPAVGSGRSGTGVGATVVVAVRTTATLAEAAGALEAEARPHLVVDVAYHHTVVLGPLVVPGETACLTCLAGRVGASWPDEPPPAQPAAARAELLAGLVAVELEHLEGGGSLLAGRSVALDLRTWESREELLLRLPSCPRCGTARPGGQRPTTPGGQRRDSAGEHGREGSGEQEGDRRGAGVSEAFEEFWLAATPTAATAWRLRARIDAHQPSAAPRLCTYPGPGRTLPRARDAVTTALGRRRSQRSFAPGALAAAQVGSLCEAFASGPGGHRAFPSAGGLYPLEVFVVLHEVRGLDAGVHCYNPDDHSLSPVGPAPPWERWQHMAVFPAEGRPQAVFVFVLFCHETLARYGELGGRLALLEVGHAAENLALRVAVEGLAGCEVGAPFEDALLGLIGLAGSGARIPLAYAVGLPAGPGPGRRAPRLPRTGVVRRRGRR